jgi:FtsH-binding integral membrane protein
MRPTAVVAGNYLGQAFLWMFAGLFLTAVVTAVTYNSTSVMAKIADLWLPIVIGQFLLVMAIQFLIQRISATLALGLFFVYAASLGFTMAVILSFYELPSVFTAFISASAMFGGAGLYGVWTGRSLAGIGPTLIIGAWGLLVAIIVNTFVGSGPLGMIISIIGVVIFTALTAYDTQRISSGALVAATGSVEKAAILGAIHLYIDFVNIFLFLLRLLGNRR